MSDREASPIAGQVMPLDPDWGNVIGEFVYIPPGEFMMGSTLIYYMEPVHEVEISKAFEMGKYEVTQQQWQKVMGYRINFLTNNVKENEYLPVETVGWDDAQKFISTLNSRSKKYIYRLPTEAEWEYACRAGTTGNYAGNLDAMAWYMDNSGKKTHPVGQKQPNGWGLYDMNGNLWEWCSDWHERYQSGRVIDPIGAITGLSRALRGGSHNSDANDCMSASRMFAGLDCHSYDVGFRLVRTRQ